MGPEMLLDRPRPYYGNGADVWSLGCVLGEMLRGEPIFTTPDEWHDILDPSFNPQLEAQEQVELVDPRKRGAFTSTLPDGQWEEWSWVERLRALEQQGYAKSNQLISNVLDPRFDPQLEAKKQVDLMDPSKKGKFTSTLPDGQWEEWSWVERLRALEQQGEPKFNQLKKIFAITGKPTEAQIDSITMMPATIYSLKGMKGDSLWKNGQEAKGWSSLVPKATPMANDLLVKLMQLDPRQRITAMQGLQHPYCKQSNKDLAESEYTALNPVSTWLGAFGTNAEYRDWLYQEIPNIKKRDADRKQK